MSLATSRSPSSLLDIDMDEDDKKQTAKSENHSVASTPDVPATFRPTPSNVCADGHEDATINTLRCLFMSSFTPPPAADLLAGITSPTLPGLQKRPSIRWMTASLRKVAEMMPAPLTAFEISWAVRGGLGQAIESQNSDMAARYLELAYALLEGKAVGRGGEGMMALGCEMVIKVFKRFDEMRGAILSTLLPRVLSSNVRIKEAHVVAFILWRIAKEFR